MKKKNSLIGHNRPPRKHNYPKFRKPVKQFDPFDPRGECELPPTDVLMSMNSKTLNKVLNANWRAWKRKKKRFARWEKRMKRIDNTIEKHRQNAKEKEERQRQKDRNKKVKIRPRDITWIAY